MITRKGMQMKALTQALLFVVLGFPGGAEAGPAPADFSSCAVVRGAAAADSLYQVHLPAEVIQQASPGLNDLRLFDGEGRETPFTIVDDAPPSEETPESYPLEITGFKTGPSASVITMKLPEKHRPISVLDLDIAERDFRKRLVLSTSRDGRTWQRLAEDSVYDFTSQVDLRKTRIEFSPTDARFFRIELADVRSQPEPPPSLSLKYEGLEFTVKGAQKKALRIRAVTGSAPVPAGKAPLYDQKDFTALTPALDKDGNTVIVLPAALPLDRLSFDIADRYYYRTVSLSGSATGKEDSYRLLASRQIYRFPLSAGQHEEKNRIDAPAPKYAWYKLVVRNKSNPPLDIRRITVSWVRKNLYFMAAGADERYSLCFGNHRLAGPDYDIAKFVDRTSLAGLSFKQATLAAPVKSGGPSRTLGERMAGMEKTILRSVVVLLVIGMGGWLYTLLRKGPERK